MSDLSDGIYSHVAAIIGNRRQAFEDLIYEELVTDRNFAPVDPERGQTCRIVAQKAIRAITRPRIKIG